MGIWEQLGLDMARHRMVALVGAGGKTSTLYALARQAADSGRTVVVTTTTHILRHPGLPLVEEPTPERLRAALEGHGVVTVGTVFRGDKLSGTGGPPWGRPPGATSSPARELRRSCAGRPMWYWWRPTGPSACPSRPRRSTSP